MNNLDEVYSRGPEKDRYWGVNNRGPEKDRYHNLLEVNNRGPEKDLFWHSPLCGEGLERI